MNLCSFSRSYWTTLTKLHGWDIICIPSLHHHHIFSHPCQFSKYSSTLYLAINIFFWNGKPLSLYNIMTWYSYTSFINLGTSSYMYRLSLLTHFASRCIIYIHKFSIHALPWEKWARHLMSYIPSFVIFRWKNMDHFQSIFHPVIHVTIYRCILPDWMHLPSKMSTHVSISN